MKLVGSQSGRSENGVSFLTYFRFPSSHTTVRAVRHTAVSCLSCPFWTPHIGHRHFFSIVRIRPIVLKREFLFGHLTTTVSKYTDCLVRQCTIRPFALTVTGRLLRPLLTPRHSLLLSLRTAEASRDKPYIFPRLPAWFTQQGYGCL